jgi:hypothetical protein
MSDYAAAPIQPIVQGLLTVSGTTPSFVGKGVSSVSRTGAGDYVLTLDPGLPGEAGALDPNLARSLVTLRGGSGAPPVTTITQVAVVYHASATPGVGDNTVELLFSIAGTPTELSGAASAGAEVVIWKALQ